MIVMGKFLYVLIFTVIVRIHTSADHLRMEERLICCDKRMELSTMAQLPNSRDQAVDDQPAKMTKFT